ncbi:MAG: hypothetical protein HFE63_04110 [Clostridiales bacterium]|nr:hypothetical protein [Clostridiales bacterium]
MKKILSFVLCAVMLMSVAVIGISAANAICDDSKPEIKGEIVLDKGAALEDVSASSATVVNLNPGGDNFCPKADQWVRYDFEAPKDGTYTIVFEYQSRPGSNRGINYAIDTDAQINLDKLDQSNDQRWATVTAELKAGSHSITFYPPTGFDDTSLKAMQVHHIYISLTQEAVAEAPVVDNAPATADAALVAVAALAVSATAAIVVAKKRH